MTISSELTALQQDITDARTAIVAKGGTTTPGGGSSQLASDINTIPTGGPSVPTQEKSVLITQNGTQEINPDSGYVLSKVTVTANVSNPETVSDGILYFIDYDGTILHQYTKAEALALTALPANPTRTGMTSQGWNFTLAEIQTFMTDNPKSDMWVGQLYITDDMKTRFYITVCGETKTFDFTCLCVNGILILDWGDGSTQTVSGTSLYTKITGITHSYATDGDYVITLSRTDNTSTFRFYNYGSTITIFSPDEQGWQYGGVQTGKWSHILKKVEFGDAHDPYIDVGMFDETDVRYVNIPEHITEGSLGTGSYSVVRVVISKGAFFMSGTDMPRLEKLSIRMGNMYNRNSFALLKSIMMYFDGPYGTTGSKEYAQLELPLAERLVVPLIDPDYGIYQTSKLKLVLPAGYTIDNNGAIWRNSDNRFVGANDCTTGGKELDLSGYTGRIPSRIGNGMTMWEKITLPSTVTTDPNYGLSIYCPCLKELNIACAVNNLNTSRNKGIEIIRLSGALSGIVEIDCTSLKTLDFTGATKGTASLEMTLLYMFSTDVIDVPAIFTTFNLIYSSVRGIKVHDGTRIEYLNGTYHMELIDFRDCTAVSVLSTASYIRNLITSYMSSTLKIVVPDALYNDWIVATNWSDSTIVSHIIKASEYIE